MESKRTFWKGIRYILVILALAGIKGVSFAQQGFTMTSLYQQNLYNLNPAQVGYNGCFVANLQNKKQWLGTAGTPLNYMLQVQKSIGASSGVGINIDYWKAGLIRNSNVGLTFAKHIAISDNGQLSFGLNGGMLLQQFNGADAVYFDAGDAALTGSNASAVGAVFDLGAMYRFRNLKVGLVVPKVFGTSLGYNNSAVSFDQERELRGHISYKAEVNDRINFEPMAVYRQLPGSDPLIDLYGRLGIGGLGIGGGYRTNGSMLATVDFTMDNKYKLAYAFDYGTGNGNISGSSHEILLGINFCKDKYPYLVNIQQQDSSYQENPFKNMTEVAAFQEAVKDTNESLGKRIQKELDKNPGAMVYNVPLPEPIELHLKKRQYQFETFEQMEAYFDATRKDNPKLYDQLMDAYDDDNPITLRSLRDKYQFSSLKRATEFMDSLKIANPSLAAQIRSYTPEDNSLILNVEDKKIRFSSLEELQEFLLKLEITDPVLAAQTRQLLDENPNARIYHVDMPVDKVETVEQVEDENGNQVWEVNAKGVGEIYAYTINILDSADYLDANYFSSMHEVRNFEAAVRDTNEELAVRIQGAISERPSANVWNVYRNNDIVLRLHGQKYKFRTLKELNEYLLKLESEDPDLAVRIREAMNDETELIVPTSQKKYRFTTLKNMTDYSLKLLEENPSLSAEFDKAVEDNNLLLVQVEGERYKFKTLKAMNDYILNLEKSNPGLAGKIRDLVDEDPNSLRYDIELAKKIDMEVDEKTGEVSFISTEIPQEDLTGYVINIVDSNNVKEYNFFQEFKEINPYVKSVEDTNERLAARIKAEITEHPKAREFNVSRHEEIILRLHGQKYKFRTLKELDDYIMSIELSDPDLAIRLKQALEDETELIVPTSKKEYRFKTLKGMTDYAWSIKDSDPDLFEEFITAMEDGNLLIVNVKGQKFKFHTLKQMEDYLLKLDGNNPALAGKIRGLMEEEPTALIYELKLGKKIDLVYDEESGESKFVVSEVPVEDLYKKHEKITSYADLSQYIVYFDFNRTNIGIEGMATLNKVAEVMKKDPKLEIRLEGYSCALGKDKIKLAYSEQRAKNVKKYLILQGIKSRRIRTVAMGDKEPKASNASEDTRKMNRRVEVKRN